MTLSTGVFSRVSNRMSRLVTMPTSLLSSSVIGRPEIRYFFMTSMAFSIFSSGRMVMGSTIMPLSWRLTLSTSSAWSSIGHVAVDDAQAALLGQGDGHPGRRHGVHGRADDRDVEGDVPAEAGPDVGVGGLDVGLGRGG